MSLIARHLEAHGIPTLCIASALDIIEAGNPPRSVFVDYPLGHSVGRPFDRENQRAIIGDALNAFESITVPGAIERLDYSWSDTDDWENRETTDNRSDVRAPRGTEPVYQTDADRIAAQARLAALET